jgi:hypothetical protein
MEAKCQLFNVREKGMIGVFSKKNVLLNFL